MDTRSQQLYIVNLNDFALKWLSTINDVMLISVLEASGKQARRQFHH